MTEYKLFYRGLEIEQCKHLYVNACTASKQMEAAASLSKHHNHTLRDLNPTQSLPISNVSLII